MSNRLVVFCCACMVMPLYGGNEISSLEQFVSRIQQPQPLFLADLPGLHKLALPAPVQGFLGLIKIDPDHCVIHEESVDVTAALSWLGDTVTIKAVVPSSLKTRLEILFPSSTTLSSLVPQLSQLELFSFADLRLVIVCAQEKSQDGVVTMRPGVNIVGSLALEGALQTLTAMIGYWDGDIVITGHLEQKVIGSLLTATLPGKIQFFGGFCATNPCLIISIDGATTKKAPLFSVASQVGIDVAGEHMLDLSATLEFYKTKAMLIGSLDGVIHNMFGIYGLHGGNWTLGGAVEYTTLLGYANTVPLSDFIMQFELGFGARTVKMASCFSLDSPIAAPKIAFEGSLENGVSVKECLHVAADVIEHSPHVQEGKEEYVAIVKGRMPNFHLDEVRVLFSPEEVTLAGKKFSRGVVLDAKGKIFGSHARLFIDVQERGCKFLGSLQEIIWGPVKITGPGLDRIMNTPDDGLILDAELTLDKQYCFLAGEVQVNILGGISDQLRIDISKQDIAFEMNKKLLDIFDFGLLFSARLDKKQEPIDFYVKGSMHQTALTLLQTMLSKTARTMARAKIISYRQNKISIGDAATAVYNGFWDVVATVVGNAFNIKEFTFESSLDELVGKMRLPKVTIKGTVVGKEFELRDFAFDLSAPMNCVMQIIEHVEQMF